MSSTRGFSVLGLLGVILAAGLALAGWFWFSLILLAAIALTGVVIAVINWRAHH